MQFEKIEATRHRGLGSGNELLGDAGQFVGSKLPGHLVDLGVGQRRRRDDFPVSVVEGSVNAFPHQPGGALSACVAQLDSDLRRAVGVDEVDDPRPGSLLFLAVKARAPRCDSRFRTDANHLGHDQTCAAECFTAEVDESPQSE